MSPSGSSTPINPSSAGAEPPLEKLRTPTPRFCCPSPETISEIWKNRGLRYTPSDFLQLPLNNLFPQALCNTDLNSLDPLLSFCDSTDEHFNTYTELHSSTEEHSLPPSLLQAKPTGQDMYTTMALDRETRTNNATSPSKYSSASEELVATPRQGPISSIKNLKSSAALSPDDLVLLNSEITPGTFFTREHAESPAIRRRLLQIHDKARRALQLEALHRKFQDLSSPPTNPTFQALMPSGSAFPIMGQPIRERRLVAARDPVSPLKQVEGDPLAYPSQTFVQRVSHSQDMQTPYQPLPVVGKGFEMDSTGYGSESMSICPQAWIGPHHQANVDACTPPLGWSCHNTLSRPTTLSGNHSAYIFPLSPSSPDASISPNTSSYTSSISNSPENYRIHGSIKQQLDTPSSSESHVTSLTNTPEKRTNQMSSNLSANDISQVTSHSMTTQRNKRRLLYDDGPAEGCGAPVVLDIAGKSASCLEGQRRKQQRIASPIYRSNKKAKQCTKQSSKTASSLPKGTTSSIPKNAGVDDSTTLASQRSTSMTLSSSQQSNASRLSDSTQGIEEDHWPHLPELHQYERRERIDYRPLAPYGLPETIRTYPASFQASLHRVMDLERFRYLQNKSQHVLFVYGSLMISDLYQDVFKDTKEWIFYSDVVKCCMCPATVRGYSRFAVHGSDEPVMMKAERNSPAKVHGMLIFGLTQGDFCILNRYLSRGFIHEGVTAHVNLKKGSTVDTPVLAYVWPQSGTPLRSANRARINQDVKWSVEDFWNRSMICQVYRTIAGQNQVAESEQAAEQYSMSTAHDFDSELFGRNPAATHESFY